MLQTATSAEGDMCDRFETLQKKLYTLPLRVVSELPLRGGRLTDPRGKMGDLKRPDYQTSSQVYGSAATAAEELAGEGILSAH